MSSLLKEKLDKEAAELKRKLQVKRHLNVVVAKNLTFSPWALKVVFSSEVTC
jgi:hypothetical protein